jgi:hypothetical protein
MDPSYADTNDFYVKWISLLKSPKVHEVLQKNFVNEDYRLLAVLGVVSIEAMEAVEAKEEKLKQEIEAEKKRSELFEAKLKVIELEKQFGVKAVKPTQSPKGSMRVVKSPIAAITLRNSPFRTENLSRTPSPSKRKRRSGSSRSGKPT